MRPSRHRTYRRDDFRTWAFVLLLTACAAGIAAEEPSATAKAAAPWKQLEFLLGHWRGTSTGEPGQGRVERSYEYGVGGAFIVGNNKSVYPPQKANPKGEIHHDHTVISFDKNRQKFVMRQFNVEGFVNQYVLEEAAPERLVWVTESIENIPPGWRARETYTMRGPRELTERFELAAPGKEFELYSETSLRRQTPKHAPNRQK